LKLSETLSLDYYTMASEDESLKIPDGRDFDGKKLLTLVRSGNNPLHGLNVDLLIREIEKKTNSQVMDIPMVDMGSNNYVSSTV